MSARRGNVIRWNNTLPNPLISGRVDGVAEVVGVKTGYALTAGSYVHRASSNQRSTVTIPTLEPDEPIAISSVTTTRAFQQGSLRCASDGQEGNLLTHQLTSSTTVSVQRNEAGLPNNVGDTEVEETF